VHGTRGTLVSGDHLVWSTSRALSPLPRWGVGRPGPGQHAGHPRPATGRQAAARPDRRTTRRQGRTRSGRG